jgi:hypothetical protein
LLKDIFLLKRCKRSTSLTLEVIEASLTDNSVGDSTEAKNHIENIDDNINEILGDGAYDCQAIYKAVGSKGGAVTIPPPANAVF